MSHRNKWEVVAHSAAIAALVLLLSDTAVAQGLANGQPPSIQVTSDAVVVAAPDKAEIDIGITTQAQTSKAATGRNAEQLERVLTELRKVIGDKGSVETVRFSVHPDYSHRENRAPEIKSYTATNIVRATLHDLTKVSDVIDAATAAGANQIHRLEFGLDDVAAVQSRALREAATTAEQQAEALAAALKVKTVRILSAVEQSAPPVRPVGDVMFAARAEAASTPIDPGPIEVRATVTLTVEISGSR